MKLREQMNDLAIRIEMVLASHLERRYHSERSRKRDIIRCIKQETDKLITNDAKERAWQAAIRRIMSNDFADSMSDVEFYEFVTEFVKVLKNLGDKNPFARETNDYYGETKETDTKIYTPKRQRQTEIHQETDGETGAIKYKQVYEMPETDSYFPPIPETPQMPQPPHGRVISSGLTPFNFM